MNVGILINLVCGAVFYREWNMDIQYAQPAGIFSSMNLLNDGSDGDGAHQSWHTNGVIETVWDTLDKFTQFCQ